MSTNAGQIVVWCGVITAHTSSLFRAFASMQPVESLFVSWRSEDSVRRLQKWPVDEAEGLCHIGLSGQSRLIRAISIFLGCRQKTHIFCSPFDSFQSLLILILTSQQKFLDRHVISNLS